MFFKHALKYESEFYSSPIGYKDLQRGCHVRQPLFVIADGHSLSICYNRTRIWKERQEIEL